MERKTYIAPNLMDWVAQIKAGAATVKVHFTGGAITAYGVTPAEFTTENTFVQRVIERSTYFKEGRIQVGRTMTIPDPVKPKAKVKVGALRQEAGRPVEDVEAAVGGQTAETQNGTKDVEVTCLQDAQDYLQQQFGISTYKVRTKAAAQKVANDHGVRFVGNGFMSSDTKDSEITE